MEIVTALWSAGAAVAITLAVACGFLCLGERRHISGLMLCVLGLATAASAFAELGILHSASPEEYGVWLRWYYLPVHIAIVAMLLFVHDYLGTGRPWLLWAIIGARSIQIIVNFLVEPNFGFESITSLRFIPLFGEEVAAVGDAVASPRQWFAVAINFLIMMYLADAVAGAWRKGARDTRRRAIAVGVGIAAPMLLNVAYTQLVVFGVVQVPVSNVPWLLGALVLMAVELALEFVRIRRDRLELAQMRARMAQAERVTIMGQLASTLGHELGQPMAAILLNVEGAKAQIAREQPNLAAYRSLLDDIGKDAVRVFEVISRMRDFLKRGAVEVQPLNIEAVVQEAVALMRGEAIAKNVMVSMVIPEGLPSVMGDRVHLSQVLLNLLMNGFQAVENQPFQVRRVMIEVRAKEAESEVEVAVRDSGTGIPDEIAADIFKPFFTTNPGGIGVGLALSRAIIEAHGGRLWIDRPSPDRGAVFRFTLRQAPQARQAAAHDSLSVTFPDFSLSAGRSGTR
jgi:signal transduction histidine kinase